MTVQGSSSKRAQRAYLLKGTSKRAQRAVAFMQHLPRPPSLIVYHGSLALSSIFWYLIVDNF